MTTIEENNSSKKSWWQTLPGVLTAIAGFITAISGLVLALYQTGVLPLSQGPNSQSNTLVEKGDSGKPQRVIDKPKSQKSTLDHKLVRRSAYRTPITAGTRLSYYDFDSGMKLDDRTNSVDFFFKPDDIRDPKTKIGVAPVNGAKYAPRSAGSLPWEVDASQFTSAGGVYSVPQGQEFPCMTSNNRPCTFQIRLEAKEMLVPFALYQ